jgi:hypothetical protein
LAHGSQWWDKGSSDTNCHNIGPMKFVASRS